jgi:hypothetical protein
MSDVLGGMALATAPFPVVGDVAGAVSDAAMYAAYPEERTMLNAGLSLAGLLPFVPAASTIRAGKNAINIGKDVKNMGSIPASLENYEIINGVQTLPINAFESTNMYDLFYDKNDMDRVRSLAGQIQANNRIDPLIVVQDKEGYYVLEGGHRLGALDAIGAEEVPAIIVKDLDDPYVPQASDNAADMLGGTLDMSQAARMQRATEMGFEPQTYYHGTNTGFDSFDPTKADPSRRGTIFMSDNPAVASTYATIAGSKNVMPLMIRPERPIQVYASGANWNKLQGDTVVDLPARVGPPDEGDVLLAELRGTMPPTSKEYPAARSTLKELFPEVFAERLDSNSKMNTNDLSRWAQYQGADSLIFHDIIDTGPTFLKNKKAFQPSKNVVMFEPEKIRSIYADFNPAKRSSANLSAGIVGGAVGLSALRNISQQEEK